MLGHMASVTVGRGALAVVRWIIAQGADNSISFRYNRTVDGVSQPQDLTGYSARAQIRVKVGGIILADMSSPDQIVLSSSGVISVKLPRVVTESELWNKERAGVWDLELTSPDGSVVRFAEGTVDIRPDVTRAD